MRAGVAFGSNLGDRRWYLQKALEAVLALPGIGRPVLLARIYETEPIDTEKDAGAFLNSVAEVEWNGEALALVEALQKIEQQLGRPALHARNSSRVIDLDLLYAGDCVIDSPRVMTPHPRLHLRRFVLQPLADIRPDLILPGQQKTIAALLADLPNQAAVRVVPEAWGPSHATVKEGA